MLIVGLLNIHRLFQDTPAPRRRLSCVSHLNLVFTLTFLPLSPTQLSHIPQGFISTPHLPLSFSILLMPQNILSQPRTWGTRFDSFISDASPPRSPQIETTKTTDASDVATERVSDDTPRPKDQRMPHDASIFVGRYLIVAYMLSLPSLITFANPTLVFRRILTRLSCRACYPSISMNIRRSRTSRSSAIPKVASAPSFNARLESRD